MVACYNLSMYYYILFVSENFIHDSLFTRLRACKSVAIAVVVSVTVLARFPGRILLPGFSTACVRPEI